MTITKIIISMLMLSMTSALAVGGGTWGYQGTTGPDFWGNLRFEYSMCAFGKNQSPVDIRETTESLLPELEFNYQPGGEEVLNNTHSIVVNYAPGSTLHVNGRTYTLKQFHFHSPSENAVDGQLYPLEMHLVHADETGNLAVVAVFFALGEPNAVLGRIWQALPDEALVPTGFSNPIAVETLLPKTRDYYRYSGSLTTPPCSEGVTWLVMKEALSVSEQQVSQFLEALGTTNNRPLQPRNARLILR